MKLAKRSVARMDNIVLSLVPSSLIAWERKSKQNKRQISIMQTRRIDRLLPRLSRHQSR